MELKNLTDGWPMLRRNNFLPSSKNFRTNPAYFQGIFTAKVCPTALRQNGLELSVSTASAKADILLTTMIATDTLSTISLEYFLAAMHPRVA